MLRQIFINSIIISIICYGCLGQSREKNFLAMYEFEDFSDFKGVDMYLRGLDKDGRFVVHGFAPHFKNDSLGAWHYVVKLDKDSCIRTEIKWVLTEKYENADTVKLQQLAQRFIDYKISRLNVDKNGNVFVYFGDLKLKLAQFADKNWLTRYSHGTRKWINIRSNWYRLK